MEIQKQALQEGQELEEENKKVIEKLKVEVERLEKQLQETEDNTADINSLKEENQV